MLPAISQVISERNSPAVVVKFAMTPACFQALEEVKEFGTQQATISATANVDKSLPVGDLAGVAEDEDYELNFSVYLPRWRLQPKKFVKELVLRPSNLRARRRHKLANRCIA